MNDLPIFVELHALPTDDSPDPVRIVLNLRNVRSVIERSDRSIVETSSVSVGTVHVQETWADVARQVHEGGVLGEVGAE